MKTVTMNISMPEGLKTFVDSQVATNHYSGNSEYIRELVRRDQMRTKQMDEAIEMMSSFIQEGLDSPVIGVADEAYFKDARAKLARRLEERRLQARGGGSVAVERTFEETHG